MRTGGSRKECFPLSREGCVFGLPQRGGDDLTVNGVGGAVTLVSGSGRGTEGSWSHQTEECRGDCGETDATGPSETRSDRGIDQRLTRCRQGWSPETGLDREE